MGYVEGLDPFRAVSAFMRETGEVEYNRLDQMTNVVSTEEGYRKDIK